MKIMDLPGDDEECQIDAVVDSKTKKSKQARFPFQALVSDSPVANKKRKLPASPGSRNAKQPKVNTKENAFKVSKKNETDNIVVLDQKDVVEKEETNSNNETDDVKDSSKTASTEDTDIKNKKSTPGKGPGKVKKPEKIQASPLTKFFKKVEKSNTESKSEHKSTNKNKEEETGSMKSVNNTKNIVNMTRNEKGERTSEKKGNNEKSQDMETDKKDNASKIKNKTEAETDKKENDSKNRNKSEDSDKEESDKDESSHVDTSCLDESDKMDVDSDILLSDDSDDDSGKSDTDSKRTEHEDTDSKDDRSIETKVLTPTRNKLLDSSSKNKKLTPKQLERKLEIQKKRESREKQRLEREQKLQEERESRKKEKEEKKREREEKEKLLKEQKRKDKELKELKKQAEIEQKQKEKEAKEEDRRKREEAKEEEKKRKEEERLEAERKKLKAASNFVSFFVAKRPTETKVVKEETKVEGRNFMPFEIKADMRVAPRTRRNLTQSEKSKLDELIINSDINKSELYINEIKNKKYSIRKSERTWSFESSNDDIIILEDEDEESANVVQAGNGVVEKHRAKLLLFGDNRRPPYWGTWRKKSKSINPRRPFTKDTKWFDYEVDSDDEWEEEEPGESIHGSEDEKEKDEENAEENEYDVDNDFMVPHGYLSEEEIGADEEDDDEEEGGLNPENQKTKLKILGEQFEAERNAKTKKLKPKVIGCIWLAKNNAYPENTPPYAVEFLTARHAWVREIPVVLTAPAEADNLNDTESGTPSHKHASSARKAKAMEEAMPDLIRLLHYNPHGRGFLVKEFIEFWSKKREGEKTLPKMKVHQKFQEIAKRITCSEPGPMNGKACWYVNDEIRTKYLGEEKLDVLNNWTYCLIPKRKNVAVETVDKADEKEKEKEKKTIPLITQFTKTLTAEELQKQLLADKVSTPTSKAPEKTLTSTTKLIENSTVSISGAKATPPLNRPPKRASLISVPRGESFPKSPRVSLMDKFVTKDSLNADGTKNDDKSIKANLDDDDCMIIEDSDEADVLSISSEDDNVKNVDESDSEAHNIIIASDKSLNFCKNSDIDIMEV